MSWFIQAQNDEYANAIANGDMVSAAQMVETRALEQGYKTAAFHSTNALNFTVFNTDRLSAHFGSEEAAQDREQILNDFSKYVGRDVKPHRMMRVFLRVESPLRMPDMASIDSNTGEPLENILDQMTEEEREEYEKTGTFQDEDVYARSWEGDEDIQLTLLEMGLINIDQFEDMRDYTKKALIQFLMDEGYDSIIYKNNVEGNGSDSYIVLDPRQVKLADAITKDDNGVVIPLNQRFNPANPDVRY